LIAASDAAGIGIAGNRATTRAGTE